MRKSEEIANKEREIVRNNIEEVRTLYEIEKQTISKICGKFNVKFHNLKQIMVESNIKIRTQSENQLIVMNRLEVKKNISEASKKSQQKRKETNIRNYGFEVAACGVNWNDDYEKEHGVRYPNQREEFRERMTGDNNPAKRIESREKIKQNRWVNKSSDELSKIWGKTLLTWKTNLDVDNPLKSKKVIDKIRKTNMKNRGVEWVVQDPKVKEKALNSHVIKMKEKVKEKLSELDLELVEEFTNVTSHIPVKCLKCGFEFETVLDYVFHDNGKCPKCYPKNSSKNEIEIRNFIESIIPKEKLVFNDRRVLKGKELDLLIPEKKIAIEHDGIFYHSEKRGVKKEYHINKTNDCLNKGIDLFHIFEDEWYNKKDLIKNKILYKIDKFKLIYPGAFGIKEYHDVEVRDFIIKNDLYEYLDYDLCITAYEMSATTIDELISLVTFKKIKNNNWEIRNFCVISDYNPKIILDIVKFFTEEYNVESIIVHTNKRFFDKDIFETFIIVGETQPDYSYFKSLKRITKKEMIILSENNSEEYSKINGWFKIWDCGNYIMKYKKQTINS